MIYLLFFLLPVQLGTFFFIDSSYVSGIPIDYLALSLYLTDLVLIISAVTYWRRFPKIVLSKKILLLLGLLLLNVGFALSPPIALFRGIKILEIIALFYMVKRIEVNEKKLLRAFLAMGVIQLFLAIGQVTQGHALQGIFYFLGERFFTVSTPGIATVSMQGIEVLRAYGTFSHPNSLAGFYLLVYTFFLYRKVPLATIFLAICTLLIFLSFSKMAIATHLLITIWYVFKHKTTCTLCTLSAVIVPVVLAGIFFSATGDAETIDKRIWLAAKSVLIIRDHWLTGVGLGNYLLAQATFPIPYSYFFLQPVHNIFLLSIAELGIPFFFLLSYFLISFIKNVWTSPIGKALVVVICITGFFDHYWWTLQQNILLLPVIFGLLQSEKDMIK